MTTSPHTFMDVLNNPLSQYYVSVLMIIVPVARIFQRAGLSVFYAAFLLVPWFGTVLTALAMVLQRWPVLPPKPAKQKGGAA